MSVVSSKGGGVHMVSSKYENRVCAGGGMSMAMSKGGGVGVVSSKYENETTSGSLLNVREVV